MRYAWHSNGSMLSFTVGILMWLASLITPPIEAMAIVHYFASYFPGFLTVKNGVPHFSFIGLLVAVGVLLLLVGLNYFSAKAYSKMSVVIVSIKVITPVLVVWYLMSTQFHSVAAVAAHGFMPSGLSGITKALVFGGILFSFLGINGMLQLAGEVKNPQKNLPLALLSVIGLGVVIYVFIQWAFIGSVPINLLHQGWKGLLFPHHLAPFIAVVTGIGVAWLVKLIYLDSALSPLGTAYIYTASTARINYGLGQEGLLPKFFIKLNSHNVPFNAVCVNFIIAALMVFCFPGWKSLVSFCMTCCGMAFLSAPVALIRLRKNKPSSTRPFRLPCAMLFAFLAYLIISFWICWSGPKNAWYGVGLVLLINLVLLVFKNKKHERQELLSQWRAHMWYFVHIVGIAVLAGLSLSLVWSAIILCLLASITFKWAISCRTGVMWGIF